MKHLWILLVLTGCASEPHFIGGATSDYRPAPARPETVVVKDGGVKEPCRAVKVKRSGDVIDLSC